MDGSNICLPGTGQEDDWKILYESAFPQDERTPVDDLRKFMTAGTCLLHRTTNKANELLCFSVVNLMSNFGFLAYIATDSTKRSTGVGSKHMKQLIDNLKQSHPTHIGLFLEIESTKEAGLDEETQKLRNRRLAFYQRLGAKRLLNKKYHMPACTGSASPRAGELLWIELQANCITDEALPKVITEIYEKGYGLKSDNPYVKEIVDQWTASTSTSSTPTCACAENPPQAATPTPTPTPSATTAPQDATTAPQDATSDNASHDTVAPTVVQPAAAADTTSKPAA